MFKIAVCGFRGSGKTTLINQIIGSCLPSGNVVVLENDSGDVQIASPSGLRQNIKVFKIDSGCICCQCREKFHDILNQLPKTAPTDLLILEAYGLASVNDILSIDGLSSAPVISAIDVTRYYPLKQVRGELFLSDVRLSSIIYLTHTQSFDGMEAIRDEIRALNPGCRILADGSGVCAEISILMKEAGKTSYRKLR